MQHWIDARSHLLHLLSALAYEQPVCALQSGINDESRVAVQGSEADTDGESISDTGDVCWEVQ